MPVSCTRTWPLMVLAMLIVIPVHAAHDQPKSGKACPSCLPPNAAFRCINYEVFPDSSLSLSNFVILWTYGGTFGSLTGSFLAWVPGTRISLLRDPQARLPVHSGNCR